VNNRRCLPLQSVEARDSEFNAACGLRGAIPKPKIEKESRSISTLLPPPRHFAKTLQ